MSRQKKVENILILEHIWPWNVAIAVYKPIGRDDLTDEEKSSVLLKTKAQGLLEAMETLTERERDVLAYRYRDGLTLEETGKKYHIVRERVRQVEARALRKLRHPMRREIIEGVSYSDYKSLREDFWELQARYERVHAQALEECMENMCDAKAQLEELQAHEAKSVREIPIVDMGLSVRSCNCLIRHRIQTVGDIVGMTAEELMKVRNLGRRSLDEIVRKVNDLGLVIRYASGEEYKVGN